MFRENAKKLGLNLARFCIRKITSWPIRFNEYEEH